MKRYLPPTKYVQFDSIKPVFPSITAKEIQAIFDDQSWRLPEDYAEFLTEWNGVTTRMGDDIHFPTAKFGEWQKVSYSWPKTLEIFRKKRPHWAYSFAYLSGIGEKAHCDLRASQEDYSFRDFIPTEFIRIGGGHFDDSIALGINGPHFGKVAYFYGAEANWPLKGKPIPSIDYLHLAALSFREFWDSFICVPL